MVTQANARQVGGSHYKVGGEEHWDRVHRLGLDYFQAQITKYVERCWQKNGIQDLEKARHFLDKYIELKRASADNEAGSEPQPHGYVHQDRSRKEVLREAMAATRPNRETDSVVCGWCSKVYMGWAAYEGHVCPEREMASVTRVREGTPP